MLSETSQIGAHEQGTNVSEPRPPVEGDGSHREESESRPSTGAELPINQPTETVTETSGAINSSSKSASGSWWPLGGGGEQVATLQRQNRELESQVEQFSKALNSKEKELRELDKRVESYARNLSSKEKQHREELAEKEGELAELKKTLCMYDECSEVDIGNMVDGINTRIQSLARNQAVRWVKEASKASGGGDNETMVSAEHIERLTGVIGVQLVNALKGASLGRTKFTAVFMQLAWQASIVSVVKRILSSFSASLAATQEGSQIEHALRTIEGAVKGGEVQPAYGRWRLVTHRYLRQVVPNEEQTIQIYVDQALDLCHTACQLAMKNHCPGDESFGNALGPQTKEIVEEAFKLLTTIQEKMVTTNYQPEIRANGRTFRPEKMTVSKQDLEYPNDRVVCTTGIGMLYTRRKGRELIPESQRMHVFKKPQVLTEANLNDMVAG